MRDISLALGGGGVKGIAHIGVIHVLEQAGFKIKAIAGTSIGALVGSIYAAGYSSDDILNLSIELSQTSRFKIFGRREHDAPSLLGYAGLAEMLTQILGKRKFNDLKIPFACSAVDLNSSREAWFRSGKVIDAVLASIAIPGIFPPKQLGSALLVDGGVSNPVPVNLARMLSPGTPVVAVVLSPASSEWKPEERSSLASMTPIHNPIIVNLSRLRIGQSLEIIARTVEIVSKNVTELRLTLENPEYIIRPDVSKYGMLDNVDADEVYMLGRAAARAYLPTLEKENRKLFPRLFLPRKSKPMPADTIELMSN
ncbi:MAG TPA: patatin-like phospholipase family protein [Anaerolineaceae bacterium]